ncbi:hypothetical protein SEA_LEWANDO_7 [Arthrobacter phage Lewando]|nr:hypothetical protein SEA_LEWANDO_7 [Arthrobacter phage Lewando]
MGQPTDEFLAHYGVLGMKWGRRRAEPEHASEPARPRVPASEDAVTYRTAQSKIAGGGTDALSDKELKKVVERMNMEAQYQRLTTPQEKMTSGKRLADDMLSNLAPMAISSFANMRPQQPADIPSTDVVKYTKPSAKRIAGQVVKDVGMQLVTDYGIQIVGELLKSAVTKR